MSAQFDILAIGEVNVDLLMIGVREIPEWGTEVLCDTMALRMGGSTANFACAAAALGLKTALVSWVGDDDFGSLLVGELQRAGVDTRYVRRRSDCPTGLTVALSGAQDRAFVTALGTIDKLAADDVPREALQAARHIHIGSFFLQAALRPQVTALIQQARQAGCTASLDAGYDPAEQWSEDIVAAAAAADLFLPNETEACAIARRDDPMDAGAALADATGSLVVVKLGPDGACAFRGSERVCQPAFPVEVVDTTACGDAFNAGFVAAWLDGKPLDECLRVGNACGALMATTAGNDVSVLRRENIERLVAG